jgi:resuscitation-promoting factor RpfB
LTRKIIIFSLIFLFILSGCDVLNSGKTINLVIVDGVSQHQISVPTGSSVKQALDSASIALNALDKTDPISTTLLSENTTITITRVTEEFSVEQAIVPFEQQTVKNESLTEGQSVLIQAGANGIQQNTYRILYENGVEASKTFVSSEITQAAKPEIVMIGVQSPFSPQTIAGTLAYISASNAWVMEDSTLNRRLVVSTADLDGRVFSVSPDHEWLLFSRISTDKSVINTLWVVNLKSESPEPINTGITNVVNYADWVPGRTRTIAYSTVEPVPTAPGWNANNDLLVYRFDVDGKPLDTKLIVDINSGGISGWWGVSYEWSTDGSKVAYARPDSIGLVDLDSGTLTPLAEYDVFNTGSDWAWVPGIKWSPDDQSIFTTLLPASSNGTISIPALSVILINAQKIINLVPNCGLFCYPVPSPVNKDGRFSVAYLGAILPDQSETSRYNLKIMDRDGSNQRKYYPDEGIQGLSPQMLKWSPTWADDQLLAGIAQGNLILVNTEAGSVKQVTGDGSISKIDWK